MLSWLLVLQFTSPSWQGFAWCTGVEQPDAVPAREVSDPSQAPAPGPAPRDKKKGRWWQEPRLAHRSNLGENEGMFIPAGLADGGILRWEMTPRNRPPNHAN